MNGALQSLQSHFQCSTFKSGFMWKKILNYVNKLTSPHENYFGLENLDEKIAKHVNEKRGIFVELGAYDGIAQSNTLHFERNGWRGVLIEPQPEVFSRCVKNRPLAQVFQCACIADNDSRIEVELECVGLMSLVKGEKCKQEAEEWITRAEEIQGISRKTVLVPARTLTSVIQEAGLNEIDLLIVDVEGAELSVLKGFDFSKWRPTHVVCEDNYGDQVTQFLERHNYKALDTLVERKYTRDVIYRDTYSNIKNATMGSKILT